MRPRPRTTLRLGFGAALLTLLIGMAAPSAARAQSGNDLPDIGSTADSTLGLDEEFRIGMSVLRELRAQGAVMEDPETDDYIQSLGSRIASQVPDSQRRFRFFVVRDTSINAFALPGGFIGLNQGLITATSNEAQLASVLAHEIAHVTPAAYRARRPGAGSPRHRLRRCARRRHLGRHGDRLQRCHAGRHRDRAGHRDAAADQLHPRQ